MVFLDYDGTLTPIVSRPELAQITPEMKGLVSSLADLCSVSIVSGRSRATLWDFLGLETVIYAGSHGMDIAGQPGTCLRLDVGREFRETLAAVHRELSAALSDIPGALVELNTYTVTVHYRLVDPSQIPLVEGIVEPGVAGLPQPKEGQRQDDLGHSSRHPLGQGQGRPVDSGAAGIALRQFRILLSG